MNTFFTFFKHMERTCCLYYSIPFFLLYAKHISISTIKKNNETISSLLFFNKRRLIVNLKSNSFQSKCGMNFYSESSFPNLLLEERPGMTST